MPVALTSLAVAALMDATNWDPGRTQTNIVGENGGANYIVVAVDRIGAPNDRNTCITATGIDGGPIVVIGHPQPVVDRRVFIAIWK